MQLTQVVLETVRVCTHGAHALLQVTLHGTAHGAHPFTSSSTRCYIHFTPFGSSTGTQKSHLPHAFGTAATPAAQNSIAQH